MTSEIKNVGIMIDIESLALAPKAVITQLAFVAFDLDDPDTVIRFDEEYLPLDPQIVLSRVISGDTLIWWMGQDEQARKRFEANKGNDFQELVALVQSWSRKLEQATDGATKVEVYAQGPQFDLVAIESLMADLGLETPWHYRQVRDLRTLAAEAGMTSDTVQMAPGLVPHHALSDCRHQIAVLQEAWRRIRSS